MLLELFRRYTRKIDFLVCSFILAYRTTILQPAENEKTIRGHDASVSHHVAAFSNCCMSTSTAVIARQGPSHRLHVGHDVRVSMLSRIIIGSDGMQHKMRLSQRQILVK